MADAFIVLDHRDFRIGHHGADQILAAARDNQIDIIFQLQQLVDQCVIFKLDDLHRVRRHARLGAGFAQHRADRLIGMMRFTAAAQDHRIAGLETECRRIGGDVRAGFVDDTDDAQRYAHPPHLEAVGTAPHLDHFAHRVGQRDDLAQPLSHRLHPAWVERDAVEHGARHAVGLGEFEIFLVLCDQEVAPGFQLLGHQQQGAILLCRRQWRQLARGDFGLLGQAKSLLF